MRLLTPIFLALGLLAIPILILYMLKLRRKDVEVSSTYLWQMVLRDRQANAPWQRLKRNLLLLLQLLILAALIIALSRPAVEVPTLATGAVIVLLDGSASMQAADVSPTRFDSARDQVSALIDALDSDSIMTLILVADQPQILAAGEADKNVLRVALESAAPTQGSVDWSSALALAAGASGTQGLATTVVIVSDGGLPEEGPPSLPVEVRYLPVGESADNLAITAMAIRPGLDQGLGNGPGAQLFARVNNYGPGVRLASFQLSLDGEEQTSRQLNVPSGESVTLVLEDLPGEAGAYRAELSNIQAGEPLDDFPLDDVAFAYYQPPANRNALLVSPGNLFLEQLLALMPNVTPFKAIPDETGNLAIPEDRFGLYVLDGIIPQALPEADLLIVNPPDNELFEVGIAIESLSNPRVIEHPLTEFVEWSNVHVRAAKLVELPVWAEALVRTDETPLVFAGQEGGRRVAVVTFDLHDSDLPLQVTFPVLFSALIGYLTPAQSIAVQDSVAPNEAVVIAPEAGTEEVVVALPSGETRSFPAGEEPIVFNETGELGLYAVNYLRAEDQRAEFFAVNLFSELESDIRPAESLQLGQTAVAPRAEQELGLREFWPWLAAAALLVLGLEWWIYHRRQTDLGGLLACLRLRAGRG